MLGHIAGWADGLMALAGLGSNPGLGEGFSAQLSRLAGNKHAMRLNSRTGKEGLPVSSINCDIPLRLRITVPETVMSRLTEEGLTSHQTHYRS